jgi:hypothetical protein
VQCGRYITIPSHCPPRMPMHGQTSMRWLSRHRSSHQTGAIARVSGASRIAKRRRLSCERPVRNYPR